MINVKIYQPNFFVKQMENKSQWITAVTAVLKTFKPGRVTVRVATLLVMTGLLLVLPATPALAQAGDQISGAIGEVVTTITDLGI